jgi:cell division protein FtsW
MIIFTSSFLIRDPRNIHTLKGLGILVLVMVLHFGLIIMQPNLSTAIVIVLIMIAIMIVAGLNYAFLIFPAGAAIAGYFYIITFKNPYHWYQRLTSFMDPFADRQGDGYQVTQGLIALGNGGLKGLGFGQSIAKNMYLPEPQNDFILAILGEELGYIGFLVLMAAYIILITRLMMIALKARDRLGFYLATGVAVMLGLQVVINVAVVTSSMPATGITLPFISYGGTSIWSFMMVMGIALNVSKRQEPGSKLRRKAEQQ